MKSAPPVREASCAAVWAPWLAAPLFALLPLVGCGLAGLSRPAAAQPPASRLAASTPAPTIAPTVSRFGARGL